MKKKITFFVLFLSLATYSNIRGQVDTLWTKTFGGSGIDESYSVQKTTDGGYIIIGYTTSSGVGNEDVWIIKTNASGDTLWTKTFGGSDHDYGRAVHQTTDGGYIIAGYTSSFGAGSYDVWLIKTNSSGDTLWTKTFGGSTLDIGNSVLQSNDGGYLIAGFTSSFGAGGYDVWLIKTNSSGDTLWTKTLGGSYSDYCSSVKQTTDGGYIIVGYTSSLGVGSYDVWLIKTTSSGDTLWSKTFGGSDDDYGSSVQQTTDGGYIITGSTSSFGAGLYRDVWLIKTSSSGETLWSKTFGGSFDDYGSSVQQTTDDGYIITGFTSSFGAGGKDAWLIKTNASGDTLWTKTFGGSDDDYGRSVLQTADDGYIITGYKDIFGAGNSDVWLIKTTTDVTEVNQNIDMIITDFSLYQNYPNPFNPSTKISWQVPVGGWQTLKVYDVLGNEIETLVDEYKQAGNYEVEWDASNYPSGVFFYQLKTENFVENEKMILMK
jgi:hypothetical protein